MHPLATAIPIIAPIERLMLSAVGPIPEAEPLDEGLPPLLELELELALPLPEFPVVAAMAVAPVPPV
jgi:hypothetical protein